MNASANQKSAELDALSSPEVLEFVGHVRLSNFSDNKTMRGLEDLADRVGVSFEDLRALAWKVACDNEGEGDLPLQGPGFMIRPMIGLSHKEWADHLNDVSGDAEDMDRLI